MRGKDNTPTVRVQAIGGKFTCRSCGASIKWIKTTEKFRKEKIK